MTNTEPLDRWEHRAEWPLAAVALVFLVAYSVEVIEEPSGRLLFTMEVLTWLAWAAFLVDYLVRFWLAPNRWLWFRRHLLDLAVVALPFIRSMRLLRLVILVSALQKSVGHAIRGRVAIYTVCGAVLLVYVASLSVLEVERPHPEASITTIGQALWWAMATITTTGYGDEIPVTTTGRFLAAGLMVGGISLLGLITATIASWIVQRVAEEEEEEDAVTAAHLDALRDEIRELRALLVASTRADTSGD